MVGTYRAYGERPFWSFFPLPLLVKASLTGHGTKLATRASLLCSLVDGIGAWSLTSAVRRGREADLLNTTPAVSMVMSSVIHGVSKRYDSLITSPVLIIASGGGVGWGGSVGGGRGGCWVHCQLGSARYTFCALPLLSVNTPFPSPTLLNDSPTPPTPCPPGPLFIAPLGMSVSSSSISHEPKGE